MLNWNQKFHIYIKSKWSLLYEKMLSTNYDISTETDTASKATKADTSGKKVPLSECHMIETKKKKRISLFQI